MRDLEKSNTVESSRIPTICTVDFQTSVISGQKHHLRARNGSRSGGLESRNGSRSCDLNSGSTPFQLLVIDWVHALLSPFVKWGNNVYGC